MKKLFALAVMFGLFLSACDSKKKSAEKTAETTSDTLVNTIISVGNVTSIDSLLCQNWENKEDAEDAAMSGTGEGLEMPYRGFSFFMDGAVLENPRDKIRFGKWTYDEQEKLVNINYSEGGKAQYKIAAIGPRELILMNMADKKQVTYRADAQVQEKATNDPFHPSNNLWRIKPARAEADSAIQNRAAACVEFYSKFLTDNSQRGAKIISFAGLPTCFKWYKGGVSVTKFDNVDEKWINCFYNKSQAKTAHLLLEKMVTKKYQWDKDEQNWVKQSAKVVRQMYDTIKVL